MHRRRTSFYAAGRGANASSKYWKLWGGRRAPTESLKDRRTMNG